MSDKYIYQQDVTREEITGFTPGPWCISPASTNTATWDEIYSSDMTELIAVMHECKTRNGKDTYHREKDEANARLIASAPSMYAELKSLHEENERYRKALVEIRKVADNTKMTRDYMRIWDISDDVLTTKTP